MFELDKFDVFFVGFFNCCCFINFDRFETWDDILADIAQSSDKTFFKIFVDRE